MRHAGQSDVRLTEQGIEEAKNIAPLLSSIHFDKVFSSDLSRAMDTQSFSLPGRTAVCTPLLREFDVGSLSGRLFADTTEEYGVDFKKLRNYRPLAARTWMMYAAGSKRFCSSLRKAPAIMLSPMYITV